MRVYHQPCASCLDVVEASELNEEGVCLLCVEIAKQTLELEREREHG